MCEYMCMYTHTAVYTKIHDLKSIRTEIYSTETNYTIQTTYSVSAYYIVTLPPLRAITPHGHDMHVSTILL